MCKPKPELRYRTGSTHVALTIVASAYTQRLRHVSPDSTQCVYTTPLNRSFVRCCKHRKNSSFWNSLEASGFISLFILMHPSFLKHCIYHILPSLSNS
ncbi:hypothetical protein K439DRAFT_417396 [Ramaria rubella]|nr:hypothetical protein K439DRAFT_417396 [Ramaria rubella]